jgi:hypothetical protein
MAPLMLNLGTRLQSGQWAKAPSFNSVEGWVGPRAVLNVFSFPVTEP